MASKKLVSSIFKVTLILIFFTTPAWSEDLYSWTDEKGITHYSTKAEGSGAQKIKLKPIERENLKDKIERLKSNTPDTCKEHQGVDCSKGADIDGSVICKDGYSFSTTRYNIGCLEAKLVAESFTVIDKKGGISILPTPKSHASQKDDPQDYQNKSLNLSVRNTSNVKANNVYIRFYTPKSEDMRAKGPKTIEAYGIADYTIKLDSVYNPDVLRRLSRVRSKIHCSNCR